MTNKATAIIVIALVIIIWLFFNKQNNDIKPLNTVNLQTSSNTEKPTLKTKLKSKALKDKNKIQLNEFVEPPPIINTLNELSYMQLYEKSLLAKDCFDLYQYSNSKTVNNKSKSHEIDYLQNFKDSISFSSNGRQQIATELQLKFYQRHIEDCLELKNEFENYSDVSDIDKESIYFLRQQIHVAMLDTKPINNEEIQLKKVIKEIKYINEAMNIIFQISAGDSEINHQEIEQLKSEIYSIKHKLSSSDFFGNEAKLSAEYITLEKELKDKQNLLNLELNIDQDKLAQQNSLLINSTQKLETHLKTQYPSVFLEVFNALNFNSAPVNTLAKPYGFKKSLDIQIPPISQQIFEQSTIKDKEYFNQLLQPSLDLYLCYLGADCSAQHNRRSAFLCYIPIGRYNSSFSKVILEACEMNLEDFYFQVYLTDNQVEDLNMIFNYLVNNYAN